MTINSSTVSGNSGSNQGAGIWKVGTVILKSSTVRGNTASFGTNPAGGGIMNYQDTLTLENSTVSGNVSRYGGGIITSNRGTTTNLINSTISGNTSTNGGGGIRTGEYATINLKNTIVAGSLGGGDCDISPTGNVVNSLGHNLDSDGTCRLLKSTDLPSRRQPLLGPLTDNGGPTQTHALLNGSPAIDKGGNCLAVDQRGVARPQGAGCDIGAYEVGTGATAKKGMTWFHTASNVQYGTITVGCGPTGPDRCDTYNGDTPCTQQLPVLCIFKPTPAFPLPRGLKVPDRNNEWSGGVVATTPPVAGNIFANITAANEHCQNILGKGWRVAEFHDGWGWNFQAYGGTVSAPAVPSTRFWVHINSTDGNCWKK